MFKFPSRRGRLGDPSGEVTRLRKEVQRLEARIRELQALAETDELVELANRRGFLRNLERLIHRLARYDESAAVIFIDVDGLKHINDTWGHLAGDAALVQVARLLVDCVRKCDCVGRLSGDEFAILLERTDELGAWQMALRVVERVSTSKFSVHGRSVRLSVAVGVGMIKPGDTPLEAIARADEQMYRMKKIVGS